VFDKDKNREALIVGTLEELGNSSLVCRNVNWVSIDPPTSTLQVTAKIRYRAQDVQAQVAQVQVNILVSQSTLMRYCTWSAFVFYDEDVCLGVYPSGNGVSAADYLTVDPAAWECFPVRYSWWNFKI
jgi:tRNA U34 2-thiouridine synthase MnmA/TrmU